MVLQPNKKKQNAEKKKQEPFFYYWKAHDLYHSKESCCMETMYNKTPPYSLHCLKNMQRISGILCVTPGLHNIEHTKIISCNRSFKPFPMSVQ